MRVGRYECKLKLLISERERITSDLIGEKSKVRFLYATLEQASTGNFTKIIESLKQNDKLAYFAVDDGEC